MEGSEGPFEQVVDEAGVGVVIYGRQGVITYTNERYTELLGTTAAELDGTPVWDVSGAVDAAGFEDHWKQTDDPADQTVETVHEYQEVSVPVETTTTRIDIDGEPHNAVTVRDVSHQKDRERQLGQLHDVTARLMAAGDRSEIVQLAADTAKSILSYPSVVVRLRGANDTLEPVAVSAQARDEMGTRPDYPADGENPAARAYRTGEALIVDDTAKLGDDYDRGEARSVMYLPIGRYGVFSITDSTTGQFSRRDVDLASILATDVETALDRLDTERSLQRKNERLEVFVDVITHDIPNHLDVAGTRLDLARQTGEDSHLDDVATAHERIETVIDDMRTLVEQGKQIDDTEWIRLPDVVAGCWDGCKPEDSDATVEVPDSGHVRADRSRLKQLLENLFWNSIEHAGDDVTVRVGFLADGFYVEDDGPGIPGDERDNVLSAGYTTAASEHSGFGLAIVSAIARAHGWTLTLTEGADGGARFEFSDVRISP
jgi:PAS domain S-box-containing protein